MKHHLWAALGSMLSIAGCTEAEPVKKIAPAESCGAQDLQYLVGQPGTVVDKMRFGQQVRVIRPGMAITMDERGDRLNIWLDERGTVIKVVCG